ELGLRERRQRQADLVVQRAARPGADRDARRPLVRIARASGGDDEQRGEARAQRPQPRPTGSSAQSPHTRRATSTATSDDSSTTPPSIQARSATVPAGRLSYSMRPRFTAPSQAP